MKYKKFIGAFIISAFLLAGCEAFKKADEENIEGIRIGVFMAFSGSMGAKGYGRLNGVRLAVKEINDAGGVLGKKISLVVANTRTDPNSAPEGVDYLVNQKEVSAIIGASASSVTLATADAILSNSRKVVLISPSSTSPLITTLADSGWVWRTAPSDALQGVVLANLIDSLGYKTVGIAYIDNAYGHALAEKIKTTLEERGDTVVIFYGYPETQTTGFDEFTSQLATKQPQAVVMISYVTDGANLTREIKDALPQGYKPAMFGPDAAYSTVFLENADPDIVEGMIGTAPTSDTTSKAYQHFMEAYTNTFGEYISYSDNAYDCMYLLALAMVKANSTDPAAIRDALKEVSRADGPDAVKVYPGEFSKAVELIRQGKDIDYVGASGEIDFDDNGDPMAALYKIWKVENGQFVTQGIVRP